MRHNGCNLCHKVHSAPRRERLLRHICEEDNCLTCHAGTVASYNIAADIGKRSGHDVRRYRGLHDPTELPFTMRRHVECVDCHNPHAVQHDHFGVVRGTLGQTAKGPTFQVPGITRSGAMIERARFGYEICFRCHAEGTFRPRLHTFRNIAYRQVTQTNTRLEFQTGNPSFHPVIGPRRNNDVVSLLPPLRRGSIITCIDCHNSDNARSAGGSGPNGPHGSLFEPLLVRNYETQDRTTESALAYDLCYGCHSRDSILNDESFPSHRRHIVDFQTPCSVCHDPHGVYRGQGNSRNHSNLINFDLSVVSPATGPSGRKVEFKDTGRYSGSCTLTCHGFAHPEFPYANTRAAGAARRMSGVLGGRR
jgi:hypothetical protein